MSRRKVYTKEDWDRFNRLYVDPRWERYVEQCGPEFLERMRVKPPLGKDGEPDYSQQPRMMGINIPVSDMQFRYDAERNALVGEHPGVLFDYAFETRMGVFEGESTEPEVPRQLPESRDPIIERAHELWYQLGKPKGHSGWKLIYADSVISTHLDSLPTFKRVHEKECIRRAVKQRERQGSRPLSSDAGFEGRLRRLGK